MAQPLKRRGRGRDDFTETTKKLLAKRAGGKCSMCQCPTWGPHDKPDKDTSIGEAAHIAAAASGGPRYDPSMSPDKRSSASNGIWLCRNCHGKLDRNADTYTTRDLKKLKLEAESRAKKELGVPCPTPQTVSDQDFFCYLRHFLSAGGRNDRVVCVSSGHH